MAGNLSNKEKANALFFKFRAGDTVDQVAERLLAVRQAGFTQDL